MQTNEGDVLKSLFELIFNNIKQHIQLHCTSDGVFSTTMSEDKQLVFNMSLLKSQFLYYKCDKNINITMNLKQLVTDLKIVKKKSTVSFYMDDTMDVLHVDLSGKGGQDTTTISCPVQVGVQTVSIQLPTEYNYYHVITSMDFYRLCRNIGNSTDMYSIEYDKDTLIFKSHMNDTTLRTVRLGANMEHVSTEHIEPVRKCLTNLPKLLKLSQLGTNIKIHVSSKPYMALESNIGSMGKLIVCFRDSI